jgi:hypothetical protein
MRRTHGRFPFLWSLFATDRSHLIVMPDRRREWQWLPTCDRADAEPGILVIRDPGKMPPQLNHGGQFAVFVKRFADCRRDGFVYTEHAASKNGCGGPGKRNQLDGTNMPGWMSAATDSSAL